MGTKAYTFVVDEELWREWTNTFPREKAIDERLRELIREDVE